MENGTPSPDQNSSSYSFKWLLPLIAALTIGMALYWYYTRNTPAMETRYAFAIDHYFGEPKVFFGGRGLRYEILRSDTRTLRLTLPEQNLNPPKYLLVEEDELDFIGFVKENQIFVPLELYQIHNARPGVWEAPVSDCKTYIESSATSDTILVVVDNKYTLRGKKTGPGRYVIPFCETTREHQFRLVTGPQSLASKGTTPVLFSINSSATGQTAIADRSAAKPSGQSGAQSPVTYSTPGSGQTPQQTARGLTTKVTLSLPRALEAPWVYLNDKRLKDFTLNSARNRITFTVPQRNRAITVRAGDRNCECTASGYPLHSNLELAGSCDCRDFQVTVNLDPGLDRYRNKIRIYIDGQATDLEIPPAGTPFTFPVRKTAWDQRVDLKLLMLDDSGRAGLIDVCSFSVPTEATTVNLNPDCHCRDCPPNIKISG